MKKLFIYSIMAIISCNLIAGTRDSTTNQRATKYVKASNPVSATNNSSNIQTNNSTTKKSPSSGNWLVQKFNSDGSYYYQDPVTNEKWIPDSNGNLVIYNSTTETIIPALGVSLSKAKSACESLHVDNYYGIFDETTYECKIPVVATNWSGDITKNGQVVMTYADMGTQFNCNKNSFEQVEALRRSSQWVMPLLMAGSTGIGYGIDYAVDKKHKADFYNNLNNERDKSLKEGYKAGINAQYEKDTETISSARAGSSAAYQQTQTNVDKAMKEILGSIQFNSDIYKRSSVSLSFNTGTPKSNNQSFDSSNYSSLGIKQNEIDALNKIIENLKKCKLDNNGNFENENDAKTENCDKNSQIEIIIIGSASNSGNQRNNDDLGFRRAKIVYDYIYSDLNNGGYIGGNTSTPLFKYSVSFRGSRLNENTDKSNNDESDRVSVANIFLKATTDNALDRNTKQDFQNKISDILKKYGIAEVSLEKLNDASYTPSTDKSMGNKYPENFWTKEGLSGAVIGGAVGTVGAIGFWAAEGASIRCNISGLADIKLNKTYTIPSFKEYLRQYGWMN